MSGSLCPLLSPFPLTDVHTQPHPPVPGLVVFHLPSLPTACLAFQQDDRSEIQMTCTPALPFTGSCQLQGQVQSPNLAFNALHHSSPYLPFHSYQGVLSLSLAPVLSSSCCHLRWKPYHFYLFLSQQVLHWCRTTSLTAPLQPS